ncbi:MAG TPA: serine/threonine protein kinase [Candidatus Limnocylindria bacterium]|jgi:serine/threonine-protein kinase|nr:serine/threonine protein kinase [Candidatus Limnocylindria bacterium]
MASEKTGSVRARGSSRLLAMRYRLLERIDEGGAGEVWRARDEKLDRDVAIKLLGPGADDAFRARFADEARRAAAVVHPNVVTVFDEGRDGADAFMVMELVPGKTLREIVAERGPLPAHEVSRLITQIASALDAAHAAGVIHCDVKPANVIVDPSGIAKLTDFGIARAARDRDEQELLGTARYIAPERVEGGPVTPRTDVYGLGLLAYELLAGRPAFDGDSNEELVRSRLVGPPPALRHARVGIDERLDTIVGRALATEPDRRYASAGAFGRALAGAAERNGDRTSSLASVTVPPIVRPWSLPRLDSTVAILAVLAILLALLLFFTSFPRAGPGPSATVAPSAAGKVAPNVVGMKLQDGLDRLLSAGYAEVAYDVAPGPGGACTIVRQDPPAGTIIARGATTKVFYVPGKACTKKGDD